MTTALSHHYLKRIVMNGHLYEVSAFLPKEADCSAAESSKGEIVFMGDLKYRHREIAGGLYYIPNKTFRMLLFNSEAAEGELTYLTDTVRLSEDETFVELRSSSPPMELMQRLHERAARQNLMLRALMLEIPLVAEDEQETNIALVNVYPSGLPPTVLFNQEGLSFPVRSGLPAGILPEWFTIPQNIDWRPGDELFFYTDFPDPKSGIELSEFHNRMHAERVLKEAPGEIAVLRLSFIK